MTKEETKERNKQIEIYSEMCMYLFSKSVSPSDKYFKDIYNDLDIKFGFINLVYDSIEDKIGIEKIIKELEYTINETKKYFKEMIKKEEQQ